MNPNQQKTIFSFKLASFIFLMSAVSAQGMQEIALRSMYESCSNAFVSLYSHIPSFFSPKESQLIQDLRKNKNSFEQELYLFNLYPKGSSNVAIGFMALGSSGSEKDMFNIFLGTVIGISPINFLRYCYYQKFHDDKSKEEDIQIIDSNEGLLNTQIDGYSALGAAIIAKDVSIESKRNFIEQLMRLGFQLTKKDKMLAELELYDAIPENEKAKMILFLREKDILSEIKQNIVGCMLQPYRVTSWPLPDIASNKK